MPTPPSDHPTPDAPWATTRTSPYAAPADSVPAESAPTAELPVRPDDAPGTAPALNPPTWSGRKTAIAAALAIGMSSTGAVAAAAALPAGTSQGSGQLQPGRFGPVQPGQGSLPQPPGGGFQGPGGRFQQPSGGPNASAT